MGNGNIPLQAKSPAASLLGYGVHGAGDAGAFIAILAGKSKTAFGYEHPGSPIY